MEYMEYQPEDLIPIVTDLAAAYTGFEHSSITYETAEALMEAVLYCIREQQDLDSYELSVGPVSARAAYEAGLQTVIEKVKRLQRLYNERVFDFQDYGVECLKDVWFKGIPAFLLKYDVKYAPQETILTLDYPVLKGLQNLSGIDAVLECVTCVDIEQRFLRGFDSDYVREVLRAYDPEYTVLLENICGILLPNAMAHAILRKPFTSMGFDQEEYQFLERVLSQKSQEKLEAYFTEILKSMVEHSFEQDEKMLEYLSYGISDMARRIGNNAANHCLEKIFQL